MDPVTTAVATGAAAILGTVGMAFAIYFGARAAFAPRIATDTRDLAMSVIFRVSALHGLILGLVFAQELQQYNQVQGALVREATAIADIWNDIMRYGTPIQAEVQQALSQYVHTVINVEWHLLSTEDRLSQDAWQQRELVYVALLDLEPATARQELLRQHMLQKIQLIAELRQARENATIHDMSVLFWIAALGGLVLVTLPYFVFSPSALHLMLLGIYAGFTGLVLFLIYALADPFGGPGALSPTAFERLLAQGLG